MGRLLPKYLLMGKVTRKTKDQFIKLSYYFTLRSHVLSWEMTWVIKARDINGGCCSCFRVIVLVLLHLLPRKVFGLIIIIIIKLWFLGLGMGKNRRWRKAAIAKFGMASCSIFHSLVPWFEEIMLMNLFIYPFFKFPNIENLDELGCGGFSQSFQFYV